MKKLHVFVDEVDNRVVIRGYAQSLYQSLFLFSCLRFFQKVLILYSFLAAFGFLLLMPFADSLEGSYGYVLIRVFYEWRQGFYSFLKFFGTDSIYQGPFAAEIWMVAAAIFFNSVIFSFFLQTYVYWLISFLLFFLLIKVFEIEVTEEVLHLKFGFLKKSFERNEFSSVPVSERLTVYMDDKLPVFPELLIEGATTARSLPLTFRAGSVVFRQGLKKERLKLSDLKFTEELTGALLSALDQTCPKIYQGVMD